MRLVHEALDDGVGTIVVVGGDGTWGKCAVALARAGSPARMAFVAAGTGNDFARNLSAPARDPAAMARLLCDDRTGRGGRERRVDLGRVDDHWFLNVAGFGFDVAVLRRAQRGRMLRGQAVYVAAAVRELFAYTAIEAACEPMSPGWSSRLLMVFSNGAHFGGAFRIAPDARVDDGALDAVLVDDAPHARRGPLLWSALRGTHLGRAGVQHARHSLFVLRFREPAWFEADGELHRTSADRCEVATIPAALRVVESGGND